MPLSEVVWEFRQFVRVNFFCLFCFACLVSNIEIIVWKIYNELHGTNDESSICHINLLHPCNICSPRTTTIATSKSFSSVAWNIWKTLPIYLSSIPTHPTLGGALKHYLFLLARPDSSTKSGKIKPTQCITLYDTAPTTAIPQPGNTIPSS